VPLWQGIIMDHRPGRPALRGWLVATRRHRFVVLLAALIVLLVSVAVGDLLGPAGNPLITRVTLTGCFVLALLVAVFAATQSRRAVVIGLWIFMPVVLLRGLGLTPFVAGTWPLVLSELATICFLGYTIVLILRYLFLPQQVTFNVISAALCVYLLLGIAWSCVYALVMLLDPGSFEAGLVFVDSDGRETIAGIYFSFVTLTTLGYGDILPLTTAARTLAIVEAILGQIYLAVLVARLVGLQVAHATHPGPAGPWTADQPDR
jgi:hypothetical protein